MPFSREKKGARCGAVHHLLHASSSSCDSSISHDHVCRIHAYDKKVTLQRGVLTKNPREQLDVFLVVGMVVVELDIPEGVKLDHIRDLQIQWDVR